MESDSRRIMLTWEQIPLEDNTSVPRLYQTYFKIICIKNFLLIVRFYGGSEDQLFAFDLEEKKWLPIKLTGDQLNFKNGPSFCLYDSKTIIITGTNFDGSEGIISFLFIEPNSNEVVIHHSLISLQERLLKTQHSSSIFGDTVFLYGGLVKSKINSDLSQINLRNAPQQAQVLVGWSIEEDLLKVFIGAQYDHKSISIKDKMYLHGGQLGISRLFVLDIGKLKWEKLKFDFDVPGFETKVFGTAQIFEENIYFFGGDHWKLNNTLAIFNTSNHFWYEVVVRGNSPNSGYEFASALYGNMLIIIDLNGSGKSENFQNRVYTMNLAEAKPVRDIMKGEAVRVVLGSKENAKEKGSLEEVKKVLDDGRIDHDVVFKVRDKQFPAHKKILMIRSSYFSNMFSSGMVESQQKEIVFNEISSKAFEDFLKFIYEGTEPSEESVAKELLVYSEKILMKRLKFICERILLSKITKENAVELYEISKLPSAEDLKEASLQFMGRNQSYFADQLGKDESKVSKKVWGENGEGGDSLVKKPVSRFQKFFRKWKH